MENKEIDLEECIKLFEKKLSLNNIPYEKYSQVEKAPLVHNESKYELKNGNFRVSLSIEVDVFTGECTEDFEGNCYNVNTPVHIYGEFELYPYEECFERLPEVDIYEEVLGWMYSKELPKFLYLIHDNKFFLEVAEYFSEEITKRDEELLVSINELKRIMDKRGMQYE